MFVMPFDLWSIGSRKPQSQPVIFTEVGENQNMLLPSVVWQTLN